MFEVLGANIFISFHSCCCTSLLQAKMLSIFEFGSIFILCPPMKLLFPVMIEFFAPPSVLLFPYPLLSELAKELFPFQKILLVSPHMISASWLPSRAALLFPAKMFACMLPFFVSF